jgi:hypothetical protein
VQHLPEVSHEFSPNAVKSQATAVPISSSVVVLEL